MIDMMHQSLSLEYINDFMEQFTPLYPDRELFITPPNECGLQKLICTYLRPTSTGLAQLFDLEHIAAFVAEFTVYEPLLQPTQYVQLLFVICLTLEARGNCFTDDIITMETW